MVNSRFADGHKALLERFQNGDEIFVWGRDDLTGDLWRLEDDKAHDFRAFVKERIVCPVPGCESKLTTAHRAKKRDGLQHWNSAGGHSRESIFHSQGCALIESWLANRYPRSIVRREEYTNPEGERRADVLITSPTGERIAFEVQYSPLTPGDWARRHDSYRAQGIVDVWLFGHTAKQLRLSPDGVPLISPMHEQVIASGSALMFINPDLALVATAVGLQREYDAQTDRLSGEPVQVFRAGELTHLELRPLDDFNLHLTYGLGGSWLESMYQQTAHLEKHNAEQRELAVQIRERKRIEAAERQRTWKLRREPQQARIRQLFTEMDRWC